VKAPPLPATIKSPTKSASAPPAVKKPRRPTDGNSGEDDFWKTPG
jgi:hypothetical protein